MANAVYYFDFVDEVFGDDYRVEIWSKATNTNPAINIKGSGTPLIINWRAVNDIFEPVITSEAIVEVISETDLYWKDFYTATRGAWILKVYRNGTTSSDIIWQGQNVTESYNEPYLVIPYKSQLRFSDLGDMEYIKYQPTSTTFYSGYQSLAEVIFRCTNKLEFQLDATEYTNCINLEGYNNASVTEKSLLCNTFLDASVFRTYDDNVESAMTCMEVLKSVLKSTGCRLIQASAMGLKTTGWHIQRIEEMVDSDAITAFGLDHTTYAVTTTMYTQNLKRDITNGTTFSSPTEDICPVDQNQDLNMSERFNKVVYKYTTKEIYRKDAEILLNGKFDKGVKTHNGTSKFPKYFQVSSDITTNCSQIAAGASPTDKDLLFRAYKQATNLPAMPGFLAVQGTSTSTITSTGVSYIRTTGTESGDTVDAQTKVASNIQIATDDTLKITVKGTILKGIEYFIANSLGVNNENYMTSPVFHFCMKVTLTYDNGHKYNWFMNPTYPGYGQNKWTVWNGTPYSVGDNIIHRLVGTKGFTNNVNAGVKYYSDKIEMILDSAKFPENGIGSFSFRFYLPRTETTYMQPIGLAAFTLDNISLQYVTDGDFSDDIFKESVFFTLTDAKENAYEFDVAYGDGPDDYNLSSFRYGVVSAADQYKQTSLWRKLDDATQLPAYKIFSTVPCQRLISEYQRIITGDYYGVFDILNTLNIDDGVADKKYLIMGDSWNVKKFSHSLTMQEITAQSISVTYDNSERTFNSSPTASDSTNPNSSIKSSIFSGKSIGGAVILNQPSTLKLSTIQTTYPG